MSLASYTQVRARFLSKHDIAEPRFPVVPSPDGQQAEVTL